MWEELDKTGKMGEPQVLKAIILLKGVTIGFCKYFHMQFTCKIML